MLRGLPVHILLLALSGLAAGETLDAGGPSLLARLAPESLLLDIVNGGETFVAVGERGHVLVSDDAETWTQVVVPTRALLCAVAHVGGQRLWAAGHDGVILHSADRGRSWMVQRYEPEEEAPLFDLHFEDELHGFAVGAYGIFLETVDGGVHWESRLVDEEEPHFFALEAAPNGELYLAGEFGTLLKSTDRGASWSRLDSPYGGSFFGLLCTRSGDVFGYGLRGRVYRTRDGGESFEQVRTNTTAGLLGGIERSDGSLLLVGLSGALLESRDGGESFQEIGGGDRTGIASVLEIAPDRLLAVGEKGAVFLDPGGSR